MQVALAKLYNSRNGKDVRYCLPTFVKNSATPVIDAKGFWNPQVNANTDTIVTNDITLDASQLNCILTGPNTGGKSTVIKGVMLNALMAQTIGMAPTENLTITPFSKLSCHMNISDDIGKGDSLFAADVKFGKKRVQVVRDLKEGELSFTITDEAFTGTTPADGEEIAMYFAKRLGSYTNSASISATHFGKMAQLETENNGTFRNYHLEILRNPDNSLKRTYKFKRGPAPESMRMAFDILKEEGLLD